MVGRVPTTNFRRKSATPKKKKKKKKKRITHSFFRTVGQIWCLAFLIAYSLAPPLYAQKTTGTIFGSVKDSTGAFIPGATVEVKNTDTGATRMVQTDDRGAYWASALSPGNYEVRAFKTRFKAAHRTGIGLTVGQEAAIDLTLGQVEAEPGTETVGGFNPMIILDDVDMDYAVQTATFGSFFHQGQICLNTRRIIIQRKIYNEFLSKFVARTKSLPAGDPLNPKTIIGPIITRDAVKMIDDRVKEALARGAKAHTGAKHDGQIYYPTIPTDVPLDAAIANEETFGPVVVVEVVDTTEEAIAAANRTMYGLTSSILTGNTYKAFEMAPKVLAGIVNVNSATVNDEIHAPMGGVRDSGWGRTGPRSLDDFSDVIWINSHTGQRQYPF